jgi:hypothetical protein
VAGADRASSRNAIRREPNGKECGRGVLQVGSAPERIGQFRVRTKSKRPAGIIQRAFLHQSWLVMAATASAMRGSATTVAPSTTAVARPSTTSAASTTATGTVARWGVRA